MSVANGFATVGRTLFYSIIIENKNATLYYNTSLSYETPLQNQDDRIVILFVTKKRQVD